MIVSLELNYFRKHESLSVTFTSGLNVLRGANEIGKTTLLEGILYALGGAKRLRNKLSEVVTWGHKESELRSRVVLRVAGTLYEFKRSKNGCECNYEGGKVVGQDEVTSFAEKLLGADMKTLGLLMLASQDGLRGALEDGPAAVSGLMGKLADFDLVDRIIDNATNSLMLGSDKPLIEKLTAAKAEVESARASIPDPSVVTNAAKRVEQARLSFDAEERNNAGLSEALEKTETALVDAKHAVEGRRQALQRVSDARAAITRDEQQLAAAKAAAATKPDAQALVQLRTWIADASAVEEKVRDYAAFTAITYPAEYWEGTKEAFEAERSDLITRYNNTNAERAVLQGEITATGRKRITSGKCPTCGHAALSDEHVAKHNAEVDAEVATLTARLTALQATVTQLGGDVKAYDSVVSGARRYEQALAKVKGNYTLDLNVYPHRAAWADPIPQRVDAAEWKTELSRLEALERTAVQAEGRATVLTESVARGRQALADAEELLARLPEVDLVPYQQAYDAAYSALAASNARLGTLRSEVTVLSIEKDRLERAAAEAVRTLESAQRRVVELEKDIETLAFNNAFMTKLKKIKPIITDHLWNTVLAAVSSFFSTLRGEPSVVSKAPEGFRVDDKPIESLSGSTLDVLALAIRVALSKTFVPHSSFMVLDEPAHGCDAARTGNVLSFLASVGFEQTILASHDELSEAVADNVIALGA